MDIESTHNCYYDKLRIYDGAGIHSRPIGTYCGAQTDSFSSTGSSLTFQFSSDSSVSGKGFLLEWFAVNAAVGPLPTIATGACGGFLRTGEAPAFLFSPGWPQNYGNRADCVWLIQAPDSTVELNILSLDIESHGTCNYDKLVIRDGDNNMAQQLAVLCGREIPGPIRSTGEYMWLRFTSDFSVTRAGFNASFHKSCGGYLHANRGIITSPNYPETYPPNLNCSWHVLVQSGLTIAVHFEQPFQIANGDSSCNEGDYLGLKNGPDISSPPMGPHGGNGHFCGSRPSSTLFTSDNQMFVQFISDNSNGGQGFKIKYEAKSLARCGGTLTGQSGVIQSIGYPTLAYSDDLLCEWHLRGPSGHYLTIHFEDFNLQNSSGCEKDFVEIWENHTSGNLLGRYCGNIIPDSVDTSSNVALVRFVTDDSLTAPGFRLRFESSLEECGGDLQGPTGTFTSPNYPNPNPHGRICEWRITVQEGRQVTLTFNNLRLEAHQFCNSERVTVFNGIRSNSPVLGKLCSSVNISDEIKSSGNTMKVIYFTDGSRPYGGFSASYTSSEDADCGGIQTGESGVIASPNYPASYDSLTHCAWLLEVPQGDTITLTFSDFDIESHSTCAWDSVTVRNGGSPGSPIIGHYCGMSSPSPIQSGSNQLVVIFNSDHSVQNGGFYATWSMHTLGCGGILHSDNGTIRSPHWPQNFPENSRCSWTVITHESNHLEISFDNNFLIPSGDGQCHYSFVKVWAGTEEMDTALLATSCGNVAPSAIITPRNAFTAVFQSQEAPAPGFSATFVSRCGSNFTKPSGYIISPNYPKQYDNNMNCTYFIEANPLSVVSLTFVSFHLEARSAVTGSCDNDGLHIIRGHSVASTPFATVCGDEVLSRITISGPVLLNFYSNSHTTDFGFKLSYQITSCGGVFNFSTGIIKSPAYSYSDYPNNMYCLYNITVRDNKVILLKYRPRVPDGSMDCKTGLIKLDLVPVSDSEWCIGRALKETANLTGDDWFTDFDVALSTSCSQDYLAIYDGYNISDPPLGKFCGSKLPPNVKSSNNSMLLVFKTDAFQTARGWVITFRQTLGPQQGCGGYLTGSNSTFASPDSDANGRYDKNLNCIWFIIAPVNKLIKLTFNTFALESASTLQRCIYDYVKLYDGESENAKLAGTFCGSTVPAPFVSSGNFLTVQFVSDISLEREGFNATYTFINMTCGGTYNATWTPQNISSPNASNPDVPLSTCTWVFEAPPHQQVEITVWAFQLQSRDCHQNYLEFQDTPESSGNARIHFCGRNATAVPTFYSSMSTAIVIFKSEAFNDNSRVSFTYQIAGCNRNYKKVFGNLKSPGWPANYNSDMDCTVTLTAPQNYSISLFFHSFGIEDSSECRHDFLEPTIFKELTWRKLPLNHDRGKGRCGAERGGGGVGGSLVVREWEGLGSKEKQEKGFASTVLAEGLSTLRKQQPRGCGGTLYGDHGSFTSPGYPGTYPNHTHCEWAITAPAGRLVTVNFYFISIDDPGDCVQNYLILYDGPDVNSPSSGPYCGTDTNIAPFVASSHRVFVEFHAEYAVRPSAIQLTWDS
ncbi:Cubilin [Myotis brandtii]|uniref:Cubilin n=1 Tax=Myotis brandtii TaxID=109478 RepID=S7Q107_MYOBR|nr:Cubilin [Myotis brandtii]